MELSSIYLLSALCLDVVFLICFVISFISIEERYTLVTPSSNFMLYYREVMGYRAFQLLAFAFFFANVGMGVVTGIYALFYEYVFDKTELFPIFMVIIFSMGALSVPLWQLALKRLGKKTTVTIGFLGMMILYWSHLYLTWILPLSITLAVIAGVVLGCVFLLPQSMFSDVVAAFR